MPFFDTTTPRDLDVPPRPVLPVKPDFLTDTLPAAFRLENSVMSAINALRVSTMVSDDDIPEGFDGLDYMRPEDGVRHVRDYAAAESPIAVQRLQARLDQERRDRQILADSGGGGHRRSNSCRDVVRPDRLHPRRGGGVQGGAYRG